MVILIISIKHAADAAQCSQPHHGSIIVVVVLPLVVLLVLILRVLPCICTLLGVSSWLLYYHSAFQCNEHVYVSTRAHTRTHSTHVSTPAPAPAHTCAHTHPRTCIHRADADAETHLAGGTLVALEAGQRMGLQADSL